MKIPSSDNRERACLIYNPNAGVQPVNYLITRDFKRRKKDFECVRSVQVDDTRNYIEQNIDNHKIFVAAGGDGTVHSVAAGLLGKDKILGVLPMGSGNGFAREFGFRMNVGSLVSNIRKGETMDIDVLDINGNMCLNVSGIGLDSFVAHSFNELKLRGFLPYVWLTLKAFLQLKPFHVTLTSCGEKIFSGELFVLTFANTRQFGNNAFIAPGARPNDGKMDIVMVKPFPKILGPLLIIRLFTKRIHKSRHVKTITTGNPVIVETDENRFHIDGEPMAIRGQVLVRLKKDALRVLKTPWNRFAFQGK
jgi:diacylglycerol kinase (ATP)